MADNAIVKILTALLKQQVKRTLGEETLGVIGQELAGIGGDKVNAKIKELLGEKTAADDLEKAAVYALDNFRTKVSDDDLRQWCVCFRSISPRGSYRRRKNLRHKNKH